MAISMDCLCLSWWRPQGSGARLESVEWNAFLSSLTSTMPTSPAYSPDQPARSEVDAMKGWVLLDFGTDWCGHCQAARSATSDVLTRLSGPACVVHIMRLRLWLAERAMDELNGKMIACQILVEYTVQS